MGVFNCKDIYCQMKQLIRHILREHTKEIILEMSKKMTRDEFINRVNNVHDNKFNYENSIYQGVGKKIEVLCPEHGIFTPYAGDHLKGVGCPKCAGLSKGNTKDFIEKAKNIHKDKLGNPEYTYDNTEYVNVRTKVLVTCPKHGDFPVTPLNHYKVAGGGCPKCKAEKSAEREKYSQEEFIELAKKIHKNTYDYSSVNYIDSSSKVEIICKKHGPFSQSPQLHLQGSGCPTCQESKGERFITNLLEQYKINFVRQKKFEDCTNEKKGKRCTQLPFDFYLPNLNILIEYDGRQHHENVWGEENLIRTQNLDRLKSVYAKKNGIKLIRIPYTMKKEDIEPYILKELGIK